MPAGLTLQTVATAACRTAAVLACVAFAGGCAPGGASIAQRSQEMPVELVSLESKPVQETSTYVGTLKSRHSVALQPQVAGHITEIYARSGDLVQQGAPIMQIDAQKEAETLNSSLAAQESNRAQRDNAQATLKSLEADRESKIANLKFAEQQYDRYNFLYGQGAVSKENVDQYANRLQVARAELSGAEAQIKAQQAAIDRAAFALKQSSASTKEEKVQLQYYTVRAPFNGIIGDVPVRIGEYATTSTTLTTVTQNQPLEVYIEIPADRAVHLKKGMNIEILDPAGATVGDGNIFFISPRVNSDTQSILVKALYANPKDQLRSDEMVTTRVIWDTRPRLLVPTTAVSHLSGQDFVFVAQNEGSNKLIARQKPVQLGDIHENAYLVERGVKPGDKIVVSGIQLLSDGLPIVPKS